MCINHHWNISNYLQYNNRFKNHLDGLCELVYRTDNIHFIILPPFTKISTKLLQQNNDYKFSIVLLLYGIIVYKYNGGAWNILGTDIDLWTFLFSHDIHTDPKKKWDGLTKGGSRWTVKIYILLLAKERSISLCGWYISL